MTAILCSFLLLLGQSTREGRGDAAQRGSAPTPADRNSSADSSQRGSMGVSEGGGAGRTSIPGGGIEVGQANGLEGGRTDEGPLGGTGIRFVESAWNEAPRANANDQLRGPNAAGSFLRPADTPADMNRDPKPMGSGAPEMPVDEHY